MSGTCARSQPPQSNGDAEVADSQNEKLEKAAGWLREADGLLITAGAGMGVDSGLPDFRGREGFWPAGVRRFRSRPMSSRVRKSTGVVNSGNGPRHREKATLRYDDSRCKIRFAPPQGRLDIDG